MVVGPGPDQDEYGYLWWRVPDSPEDASRRMIVASGWGSQFIHISPRLDAVLVTTGGNNFNGRTFDMPLMELAAFRYGLSLPGWFDVSARTYEQPRNRYNTRSHLDLHDVLTNFGATRFNGGLNLAANLLGKPGKMDVKGHMVQDLFNEGDLAAINDYCRCDVLDTYFIFLRVSVLLG